MFQWRGLLRNRYIVFVAATWLQSSAGTAYMFGMYSESFKTTFGYNQKMLDGVGMAKDIGGNVGITSGFLGDLAPNWVVLLVGATQSAFGYGMLYLSLIGRVPAPGFWLVCLYIAIGTNGATFFNTAGLVTNVKNFPNSRGPVVGLLKGYIGLSGAIFTQIYMALYAPDKDAFLLLVAWLPALIAVLVIPLIRLLPPTPTEDPSERSNMGLFMALGVSLAFYLLAASLLDEVISVGRTLSLAFTIGAFLLLTLPAYVAFRHEWEVGSVGVGVGDRKRDGGEVDSRVDEGEQVAAEPEAGRGGLNWRARLQAQEKPTEEEEKLLGGGQRGQSRLGGLGGLGGLGTANGSGSPPLAVAGKPMRGEDHSLLQGFCTPDFWLIYVALTLAAGSGLTVINNLGQMGRSAGYDENSIGVLVSLLSIWNFLGRVGGGFVSEYFVRGRGWPRPMFMAITQAMMGIGHLLCASALPGSLYFATGLVGFTYGAQWGIMPAVASELFGLRNFGTMYNWLTITNPTGSYLLSVCVAGYLYDLEAEKESGGKLVTAPTGSSPAPFPSPALQCNGGHCFRTTFYIMAGACLVAVVTSTVLSFLSSPYYKAEYEKRVRNQTELNEASKVGKREVGPSYLKDGVEDGTESH